MLSGAGATFDQTVASIRRGMTFCHWEETTFISLGRTITQLDYINIVAHQDISLPRIDLSIEWRRNPESPTLEHEKKRLSVGQAKLNGELGIPAQTRHMLAAIFNRLRWTSQWRISSTST